MQRPVALFLLLLLAGCGGSQSALDPQGHAAIALKDLILLIVLVCTLIWLLVVAVLVHGLVRQRRQPREGEAVDRRLSRVVYAAVAVTVVVVFGLTIASFYTTRSLTGKGEPDVVVQVKALQWWWQFNYRDANGQPAFQSANELHIPVGHDVRLELEAVDVIHSLWIPSLAGKLDMIPGRKNIIVLHAEKPGIYRGQCAEFCGLQHAHMAFTVVADDEDSYQRWFAAQSTTAPEPADPEAAAGKAAFLAKPCAACHAIRGASASGTSGPDLTHVGSRHTIAAGLIERTRGSLAAWIADPQTMKPGSNMPLVPLSSDELRQISAYMEGLK